MNNTEILKYNPVVNAEFEKDGDMIVIHHYKKPNFLEKTLFKKLSAKPMKVDLDEIGSFIWPLCDGKNNVEFIIQQCRDKFGEKIDPVEERVCLFINQLNQNGFIKLYKKVEEQ